jgi:O-antigen/teichoic acid export membrane protein
MAGKSKLVLTNIILTSIVNLVLNSILVPRLGLAGAAIATTISWIILSLAWLIEAYLLTSIIPFRRKMLRIFLVSLVPFLILILLKSFIGVTLGSMILLGTFFILLYILLISLTKCFDKNDFLILKSIRQRITGNYSLANEK